MQLVFVTPKDQTTNRNKHVDDHSKRRRPCGILSDVLRLFVNHYSSPTQSTTTMSKPSDSLSDTPKTNSYYKHMFMEITETCSLNQIKSFYNDKGKIFVYFLFSEMSHCVR